jgi:hypothetical protein
MNTARAFFFAAVIPTVACDEAAQAPAGDTIAAAAKTLSPDARGPAATPSRCGWGRSTSRSRRRSAVRWR